MSQPCQYFVYETVNRLRQPCNKYVQPCHKVVTRLPNFVLTRLYNLISNSKIQYSDQSNDQQLYSVTTHTHNMHTDSSSESLGQHYQEVH